jgi:hypothetical protein
VQHVELSDESLSWRRGGECEQAPYGAASFYQCPHGVVVVLPERRTSCILPQRYFAPQEYGALLGVLGTRATRASRVRGILVLGLFVGLLGYVLVATLMR